jgi:ZIP family zinc transporter
VAEAIAWALVASGALLLGAVTAFLLRPGHRAIAVTLAIGSGALLGAVAYELVGEALKVADFPLVAAGLVLGSLAYVAGVLAIGNQRVKRRKSPRGGHEAEASQAIVVGTVLDGLPESFVLGASVLSGGVSLPFVVGVALSNLPEGIASSTGLAASGWSRMRIVALWLAVMAASAVASAAGYQLLSQQDPAVGAAAQSFAAGALLTMVADTMVPEAYRDERIWTGPLLVLGFAAALAVGSV